MKCKYIGKKVRVISTKSMASDVIRVGMEGTITDSDFDKDGTVKMDGLAGAWGHIDNEIEELNNYELVEDYE